MIYKQGDYVEFMTRQPAAHVMVMFGGGAVPPEEIEEERYVGRIKSVIGGGEAYLIISLQPLQGFYCVENHDKIIRRLEKYELIDELTNYQDSPEYMAPNVYINKEALEGSLEDKCESIARKAMASLFPEDEIAEVRLKRSYFLKEDIIRNLDSLISSVAGPSDELQEMKQEIVANIQQMRFKEYYQVEAGIKMTEDEDSILTAWPEEQGFHRVPGEFGTKNYLVAISTDLREVSVMRDINERSRFSRSLGPEFDNVTSMEDHFRAAILGNRPK